MTRTRIALAVAIVGVACLAGGVAAARPGGGESFSGGGGHGDSDRGGGGGALVFELIFQLLRLCFYYPSIGVPILVLVIAVVAWQSYKSRRDRDWNSGPPVELHADAAPTDITRVDPDFSVILFEDFAFRLHATAHRARASAAALDALAPYVSPDARAALLAMPPGGGAPVPVASTIVGALRVTRAEVPAQPVDAQGQPTQVALYVEIEGNVTAGAPGREQTFYTVERWRFARAATARSKPPAAARTFPCPNCGAPWQAVDSPGGQRCSYCGEVVDNGRFDWQATHVALAHADPRPPTLTEEVPERGTDLPTVHQPGVAARWQALLAADPALSEASFLTRVELVHRELNAAWTRGDLAPVRALVSDSLYDYLAYWVTAYRAQGLRNALEDVRLVGRELAKVTADRWYDAVTVRIWGEGKDYVVREATGDVVRGSRRRDRRYSEYWTFIRGTSRRGPAHTDAACPNCGAPLTVTMAGACASCGAHVTAGEFDWVLSRIEQDDTYRG